MHTPQQMSSSIGIARSMKVYTWFECLQTVQSKIFVLKSWNIIKWKGTLCCLKAALLKNVIISPGNWTTLFCLLRVKNDTISFLVSVLFNRHEGKQKRYTVTEPSLHIFSQNYLTVVGMFPFWNGTDNTFFWRWGIDNGVQTLSHFYIAAQSCAKQISFNLCARWH